jgi:hypothetical protein
VFAILMIFLALTAVLGCLVLIAGCLLTVSRKLRRLGVAVLAGGFSGAAAAFGCFTFFALFIEGGREPLLSQVAGVFSLSGFGIGGCIGVSLYVLARGTRIPNRWVDRRRVVP